MRSTYQTPHVCSVLLLAIALAATPAVASAQSSADLLSRRWTAQWITCPNAPERDPAVVHYRKVIDVREVPAHFIVHVSADNQFLLYVNQQRVGSGPARGDLAHWRFETYDLSPVLHPGRNILAATVWSFGTYAALAQISDRVGFLIQGDTAAEEAADTNDTWDAELEAGVQPASARDDASGEFFAAEPPERIDGTKFDWLWAQDPSANANRSWTKALSIGHASPRGSRFTETNWQLVPDPLPAMAYELVPSGKVVRASGIETPADFPEKSFQVAAHTKTSVLLDASHLTTAYPELTVTGGAGGSIRVTYAEALYDAKGEKHNRNEIAGKQIKGVHDEFLPDGSANRVFAPLAWRTWRYLQLDITTAAQPLEIRTLRTWFTAYPFEERGRFTSDDASLGPIWDIGWRTARLDAHDTYMDTPYWERLQYIGDTRIQALISYTVAGDDRLARQAIQAFNDSRIPDGITQSRYPSATPQFIPTFSLLWIGMVHDFWFYRDDAEFVRQQLPGTRTVLDWFVRHQRPDGLLGRMPWWLFVDWADDFEAGEPPQDANGGSAVITMQFIEALRYAEEVETALGDPQRAQMYRAAITRASTGLQKLCWSQKYGLFADTPARNHFSQHANILGVWLDLVPRSEQKPLLAKVLSASDAGFAAAQTAPPMSQATYYFRFYLARAVDHAGMGNDYLRLLQPWRDMVNLGLTTWAEKPEPTRSDSHAWSAHPNFDLLSIVAGVRPQGPEFRMVSIEPHLGSLKHVSATVPHPKGEIAAEYTQTAQGVSAKISLPGDVGGSLVWQGKTYALHGGTQQLTLPLPQGGAQ